MPPRDRGNKSDLIWARERRGKLMENQHFASPTHLSATNRNVRHARCVTQAVFDILFGQFLMAFGLPKRVSFPFSQNECFKSQPFGGIRLQNWAFLFQNFGSSRLFGLPNRSPSGGEASEIELIWHQSVVVTVVPLREVTFIR